MPARKNSPKKRKPAPARAGRVLLAIGILASLVMALVFLSHRRETQPQERALSRAPLPAESGSPPPPPTAGDVRRPLPSPLPLPPPPPPRERRADRPQVAIVMDDLGRSLEYGQDLLAIDVPVTFAILPGEEQATAVAELAYRHGREILIHLPMEPRGYPETDPGKDALLVAMPAAEIVRRVEGFRRLVPHAVGGNNHMGSRFTEDREGMRAVLQVLKEADLFFLDSRTSQQSVAYAEARQAQIPAARRDVFLDNEPEVEKIVGEIRHLVQVAHRQGEAIGICHPYPETLAALRQTASELRQAGVDLVPVAALLVK